MITKNCTVTYTITHEHSFNVTVTANSLEDIPDVAEEEADKLLAKLNEDYINSASDIDVTDIDIEE